MHYNQQVIVYEFYLIPVQFANTRLPFSINAFHEY